MKLHNHFEKIHQVFIKNDKMFKVKKDITIVANQALKNLLAKRIKITNKK